MSKQLKKTHLFLSWEHKKALRLLFDSLSICNPVFDPYIEIVVKQVPRDLYFGKGMQY